jgi:shikimate dehydrogenase
MQFAEVIGDPIVQSKSPIIHKYWLEQLGIEADYVRTQLAADDLQDFIAKRRADREWRGCNVTIPHKQSIMPLLGRIDSGAIAIGAVNCVVPEGERLAGYNSDIDGVAEALDGAKLEGRKTAVIGAGGGARAVVAYLAQREAEIIVVARNPAKAQELRSLAPVQILPLEQAADAFWAAAAIVNASSLGMAGADPMPASLLDVVRANSAEAVLFDMVTTPQTTDFLTCGDRIVDGLTMLIGQARRAFELFFGSTPPQGDAELRRLLTGADQ